MNLLEYSHVGCGGMIDKKAKQCTRCKHKWGFFSFYLNAGEIRPVKINRKAAKEATRIAIKSRAQQKRDTKHPKWAERTPGATVLPKLLPNWPRWARILSSIIVIGGLVVLILWWGGVL